MNQANQSEYACAKCERTHERRRCSKCGAFLACEPTSYSDVHRDSEGEYGSATVHRVCTRCNHDNTKFSFDPDDL